MGTDWGIASQTNPTLFVHSADSAATTDYISLTHNQTNAVIGVGSGVLNITADVTMTGTTPVLTIGDSGAEDTALILTTNAQTFYVGAQDTGDNFVIGLGSTVGTNPAITITSDGSEDVTLAGDLTVSGTGPHAFGGAVVDNVQFRQTGAFTSGGVGNYASAFDMDSALTGFAGDIATLAGMRLAPNIVTQTATESIGVIATLILEEPNITDNLTGDISRAATLYINTAPTEGGANYAIYTGSGNVAFTGLQSSIGGDLAPTVRNQFTGAFTSDGSGTTGALVNIAGSLTGASGDTSYLVGARFAGSVVTQTATESIGIITGARFEEPTITDNLTGDITLASTVQIVSAPTEGEANYALLISAGDVLFTDATFGVGGIPYEWPADNGDAGEQLQTNGSGTLTWEAAASLRE